MDEIGPPILSCPVEMMNEAMEELAIYTVFVALQRDKIGPQLRVRFHTIAWAIPIHPSCRQTDQKDGSP